MQQESGGLNAFALVKQSGKGKKKNEHAFDEAFEDYGVNDHTMHMSSEFIYARVVLHLQSIIY